MGHGNGWIASPTLSPNSSPRHASSPRRRRVATCSVDSHGVAGMDDAVDRKGLPRVVDQIPAVRLTRKRVVERVPTAARPRSRTWPVGVGPAFPTFFFLSRERTQSRAFSRLPAFLLIFSDLDRTRDTPRTGRFRQRRTLLDARRRSLSRSRAHFFPSSKAAFNSVFRNSAKS